MVLVVSRCAYVREAELESESQKTSACRHSHSGARAMIRQARLVNVPQLRQVQLSRHPSKKSPALSTLGRGVIDPDIHHSRHFTTTRRSRAGHALFQRE